jgi:D-glycero-D-manno-heptose 1,7-bisphosphate phosphatase
MMEGDRQAAVFLDRDGTINEEVGYLDHMGRLKLIPGASEAIRLINASGMKAVVVTNQSGVARELFKEATVESIHTRLREMLQREGAFIDGFYFCPHHPTAGRGGYLLTCDCRKPSPGMLLRAASELHLDLARSYMVGDTLNDIEAGQRAGARGVLVLTGYGTKTAAALNLTEDSGSQTPCKGKPSDTKAMIVRPIHIADDLLSAVKWIMRDQRA